MPARYMAAAMRHAHYEQRADGTYYGEIAGFPNDGVWAIGPTLEDCQDRLVLALHAKVAVTLSKREGFRLPTFDGIRADSAP